MKEETVQLSDIDVPDLISDIKQHFTELGLQLIHEDKHEGYWSMKAYKGWSRFCHPEGLLDEAMKGNVDNLIPLILGVNWSKLII